MMKIELTQDEAVAIYAKRWEKKHKYGGWWLWLVFISIPFVFYLETIGISAWVQVALIAGTGFLGLYMFMRWQKRGLVYAKKQVKANSEIL